MLFNGGEDWSVKVAVLAPYDMMGGFWITGDHNMAFSEIQYAVDSYFRSKECFRM
jgi:hypothetical protein